MPRHRSSRIATEIVAVRRALKTLERAQNRLASILMAGATVDGSMRRPRLSPKARASLVLQGRYMGFMRQLKPRQKAQVRKIKEAKGVRAAITRARRLAQKSV